MIGASSTLLASNAENFREHDPIGWMMAIIAMSVVFVALVVLFLCFKYGYTGVTALGVALMQTLRRKQKLEIITDHRTKSQKQLKIKDAQTGAAIDNEELAAAIGMALFMHEDGMHDQESFVLTLGPNASAWTGPGHNQKPQPLRRF